MIEFNSFAQIQKLYKNLRQQRENIRFFRYIEISATFVLITVFLVFAIRPTIIAISSLLGEIKSKEEISQKMQLKIGQVIQAQENYSNIQEKYEMIEASIPSRPKYYHLASQFSSTSQDSSVRFNSINFSIPKDSKSKTNDDMNTYGVNIKLKSTFLSLLDFIKNISNNRRIMEFDDFRISKDEETSDLNLNFSANLYYWRNQYEKN